MLTVPKSFEIRRGRYSDAYLRRDEETITDLYRANGFRDVKVSGRAVDDYQGRKGDIAVFVDIDEGTEWLVGKLTITGQEKLDISDVIKTLSSSEGQPFSEFNVAADRDTILDRYFRNGFAGATFEWDSKPSAQPNHVDLDFHITEGKQQFVREVLVEGLHTTRQKLVDDQIHIKPGIRCRPSRCPRRSGGYTISACLRAWTPRCRIRMGTKIASMSSTGGRSAPLLDHGRCGRRDRAHRGQHCAGGSHRSLRRNRFQPARFARRQPHQCIRYRRYRHFPQPPVDAAKTRGSRLPGSAPVWQPRLRHRFFRALRRFTRCPDLRRQARGGRRADDPASHQAHHVVLPLRVSQRERRTISKSIRCWCRCIRRPCTSGFFPST